MRIEQGRYISSEYMKTNEWWFKSIDKKDSTIYYGKVDFIRLDTYILKEDTEYSEVYTDSAMISIMSDGTAFDVNNDSYCDTETRPELFRDNSGKNWLEDNARFKDYGGLRVPLAKAMELEQKTGLSLNELYLTNTQVLPKSE